MIPHSHTDAGWWLTFDNYYSGRVVNILESSLDYLSKMYLNKKKTSASEDDEDSDVGNLPRSKE